jgi:oligopeptide transport system ATP-binding protein
MNETTSPLISVRELTKVFPVHQGRLVRRRLGEIRAADRVTFDIHAGETLGLVGESGCGKTTTGRTILRLEEPTSGEIFFNGRDITRLGRHETRKLRRDMQIVYQDPFGSLNPRMTVRDIVGEPLLIHRMEETRSGYRARVDALMELVGLNPSMAGRYPHEFSGGQRQRIGIARALAVGPRFMVCDEPVSALDVSIQAQIINLLEDLQERYSLTYLFIAHDLSVIRHISDRVAVMYLGEVVEIADRSSLYHSPAHPYTKSLLASVPVPDPEIEAGRDLAIIRGEVPGLLDLPQGCRFHPRCPFALPVCRMEKPALKDIDSRGHMAACHLEI